MSFIIALVSTLVELHAKYLTPQLNVFSGILSKALQHRNASITASYLARYSQVSNGKKHSWQYVLYMQKCGVNVSWHILKIKSMKGRSPVGSIRNCLWRVSRFWYKRNYGGLLPSWPHWNKMSVPPHEREKSMKTCAKGNTKIRYSC